MVTTSRIDITSDTALVFIFPPMSDVTLRENQYHPRNEQLNGTLPFSRAFSDLVADAKQLGNHFRRLYRVSRFNPISGNCLPNLRNVSNAFLSVSERAVIWYIFLICFYTFGF